MDNKTTLEELNEFEQELNKQFENKVNSNVILEKLSQAVVNRAQIAVSSANKTESYDDKIQSLVKGIQEIVALVNDLKIEIDLTSKKHNSDIDLLAQIKSRFSDYEKMEKKNNINKSLED